MPNLPVSQAHEPIRVPIDSLAGAEAKAVPHPLPALPKPRFQRQCPTLPVPNTHAWDLGADESPCVTLAEDETLCLGAPALSADSYARIVWSRGSEAAQQSPFLGTRDAGGLWIDAAALSGEAIVGVALRRDGGCVPLGPHAHRVQLDAHGVRSLVRFKDGIDLRKRKRATSGDSRLSIDESPRRGAVRCSLNRETPESHVSADGKGSTNVNLRLAPAHAAVHIDVAHDTNADQLSALEIALTLHGNSPRRCVVSLWDKLPFAREIVELQPHSAPNATLRFTLDHYPRVQRITVESDEAAFNRRTQVFPLEAPPHLACWPPVLVTTGDGRPRTIRIFNRSEPQTRPPIVRDVNGNATAASVRGATLQLIIDGFSAQEQTPAHLDLVDDSGARARVPLMPIQHVP